MAITVELSSDDKKFQVEIGEEFVEKLDFKQYLKLAKSLTDREFDGVRKIWKAPLTTENVLKLDFWISKEQMKEMNEFIK